MEIHNWKSSLVERILEQTNRAGKKTLEEHNRQSLSEHDRAKRNIH